MFLRPFSSASLVTVQAIVLEIGTAGPVSLISNIYLVVTDNFQYYLDLWETSSVSISKT